MNTYIVHSQYAKLNNQSKMAGIGGDPYETAPNHPANPVNNGW